MRWLIWIGVLDLVIAALLISKGVEPLRADLIFATGNDHRFLDPQRVSWLHDIRIVECLFEPLVKFKLPELTIEPAAAEYVEVSKDGLTYTFHLRSEARWSNGQPVRSTDFIYAWRRALLPDLAADYTQLLWTIEGAKDFFEFRQQQLVDYAKQESIRSEEAARALLDRALDQFALSVGLKAPDERILIVKLAKPTPYFLELVAFATFMPVHAATVDPQTHLHARSGRLVQDPLWTRPDRIVCNGPYVLRRRRFKRDLLLVANEHYWNRSHMGNSSILERIVPDPNLQLLMYNSKQIHWLPDLPSSGELAAKLFAQTSRDVHFVPGAGTYFYNFNCQPTLSDGSPNPLADRRVRRSLALAIDRRMIVDRITRLRQPVAYTFVPIGSLSAYDPPVESGARFDPQRARELLVEAGYPHGEQLGGLSILYNTGAGHEDIAQVIKGMWKEHLGVVVTLEGLEYALFGDKLRNRNYIISRAGWFGDYRDPTTFLDKFRSDNGNNDAGYENVEFDSLMDRSDQELDPQRRMDLLHKAEAMMLHDQPIAPIYQYVSPVVFDPDRVRNLHPNPWHLRRLEFVEVRSTDKNAPELN